MKLGSSSSCRSVALCLKSPFQTFMATCAKVVRRTEPDCTVQHGYLEGTPRSGQDAVHTISTRISQPELLGACSLPLLLPSFITLETAGQLEPLPNQRSPPSTPRTALGASSRMSYPNQPGQYGDPLGYNDPYAQETFVPHHQPRRSQGANPFRDAASAAPPLDLPGGYDAEVGDPYGDPRSAVLEYAGPPAPRYRRASTDRSHDAAQYGDDDDGDGAFPLLGGDGGVGRQFDEDRARGLHQTQEYDAPDDQDDYEEDPEEMAARLYAEQERREADEKAKYGDVIPARQPRRYARSSFAGFRSVRR